MAKTILNVALLVVLTVAAVLHGTEAAVYVVGDTFGWNVPPGINYTTWASSHTFVLNDVLVFNFVTGRHDVATVNKAAFDNCNSTNFPIISNGPADVTLNSTGDHYFFCAFSNHCLSGQKLYINVTTSSSSPATPPTGSTTSPPPPSSGSATSPLAATFSLIFINVIALTIFYQF